MRTLTGQPVDRVPFIKVFGGTNTILPRWEEECPGLKNNIDRILQFEGAQRGWARTGVNISVVQVGPPELIEDNAERSVRKFSDGTVQVAQKGRDFHHQTVEWPVKTRADWERVKARHLQADDPARFPPDWAGQAAAYRTRDYPLQLTHRGVYGFARDMMGDERLLFAFYDDPALVHDIMDYYTGMAIAIWDRMVANVEFDLIECWEDMASKNGSLISPQTFREFMAPNYRRIAEFAAKHNIKIILTDSDGFVDDLACSLHEAGVTAIYPFESGAGCNVVEVRRRHPALGIIGALAKESMIQGREAIDREMEKAARFIRLGRLIPGPDHFVLSDVSWQNYRYFMERLREVVMTTSPEQAH